MFLFLIVVIIVFQSGFAKSKGVSLSGVVSELQMPFKVFDSILIFVVVTAAV